MSYLKVNILGFIDFGNFKGIDFVMGVCYVFV